MPQGDGRREPAARRRGAAALAMAGLEIGAAIVGFTLLGVWLDGRFETGPWLMLAGLAMGLVGSTYNVWKIGRSYFDS